MGSPCDSFWLRCPWEAGGPTSPADWARFTADHQGERVFTGVVDECQVSQSASGGLLEVSGRGMAALLLDNEALGQDYLTATLQDILRDHVAPYGIETAAGAKLPAVTQFSVSAGSSEWSVLYEFARYYGGVAPRFDREGKLVLTGWPDRQEILLNDSAPVTELVCRDKRYGVLSQVLVRDRYSGDIQTVDNKRFLAEGGKARRVVTMPGRSSYKTMRYTGQFQLEKSAAELVRQEITVAQAFCAWPGDLVRLKRSNWDRNGLYRVVQATAGMDSGGAWTKLELADVDVVI
jgi:prophage tail gpP-like protein